MVEYFDKNNVNLVKYWNVNYYLVEFLSMVGFIRKPSRLNLTFSMETLVKEDYSILLNSNVDEVHFTFGDHDHI